MQNHTAKGLPELPTRFRAGSALLLAVLIFAAALQLVCAFIYTFIQTELAEDAGKERRLVPGRAEGRSLGAHHFPFSVSRGKGK